MIQSIPSPAAPPTGATISLSGQIEGGEGETALFGALLDALTGEDGQETDPSALPDLPPDDLALNLAPATEAAMPGNILPPVLPLPVPELAAQELAAEPVIPAVQAGTKAASLPTMPVAPEEAAATPSPITGEAAPNTPQTPVVTPSNPIAALVAALPQGARGRPDKPDTPAPEQGGAQGPANRTVPVLPDNASARAVAQMEQHRLDAPLQPAVKRPEPLAPLPSPAEAVRMDIALQAPAAPAQPGPVQAPAPAPQVRPLEFAALIDRLTAARDGVSSQTVSITVAHQDFGPVRLHFRPDELGLSVSLTSADPDFARVAAAAPAPVLPVQASEQASTSQQQRSDSAAQGSAQHGFAQSRGQSSERRDDHRTPQAQARTPNEPERKNQRSGIFA